MTAETGRPHTALPWMVARSDGTGQLCIQTVDPSGAWICGQISNGNGEHDGEGEANAAYIVLCCNLFPDLVAALEASEREYQNLDESAPLDAGCIECTVGTVPNNRNTGLCAHHLRAAALLKVALVDRQHIGEHEQDWRSINNAPKNGATIEVGFWSDKHDGIGGHWHWFARAFYDTEKHGWYDGIDDHPLSIPTHWRPLVAPPLATDG